MSKQDNLAMPNCEPNRGANSLDFSSPTRRLNKEPEEIKPDWLDEYTVKSKIDWSTPYDSWLIPLLNDYRYQGAIRCRAIPSVIQSYIDNEVVKRVVKAKIDEDDKIRYEGCNE